MFDGFGAATVPYADKIEISRNINRSLKILTTEGYIFTTLTRIVAHELGHAVFGTLDSGENRLDNVIENENPIMRDLNEPERTKY